ncbi:MAG: hypothetical protein MJ250_06075 [Alphaproteobacteria bacterium]|nr:hypothetical protein [Alphaproteobacteria bacterium]
MVQSVAEFFDKGDVKKYQSGKKSIARSAMIAGMVLATAFASGIGNEAQAATNYHRIGFPYTAEVVVAPGDTLHYQVVSAGAQQDSILESLVENSVQTKTGASVLKTVAKNGTTIQMGDAGVNSVGFYNPNKNTITLNKAFSKDKLQSCLIHEGKHSIQDHNLNAHDDAFYNFASTTMKNRAMEADAMMTQTMFSYELMQKGDSAAWKCLETGYPWVTDAYKANVDTCGTDTNKVMKNTMLAWYKDKGYVKSYDATVVNFYANLISKAPSDLVFKMATKEQNADSVITKVCNMDGVSYAGTDGKLLKTPETFYLEQDVYNCTEQLTMGMYNRVGRVDYSAWDMYVVNKKGVTLDDVNYSKWMSLSRSQIKAYEKITPQTKKAEQTAKQTAQMSAIVSAKTAGR